MASMNLLPWRERLREERKQQFLTMLGMVIVVTGLLLFVGDRHVNGGIDNQKRLNEYLHQQIAAVDQAITEIKQLQEEKRALADRMAVIQELQGTRPLIVRLFDELVRSLPAGVYFNKIARIDDTVSLVGIAESNRHVSALMRGLDDSDWFANPELLQVTAASEAPAASLPGAAVGNVFELTVQLTANPQEAHQETHEDADQETHQEIHQEIHP